MFVMKRVLLGSVLLWAACAFAQYSGDLPPNAQPPRSDAGAAESSSKQTQIDLAPPKDDALSHPNSEIPDVMETHPWNPLKAIKDVEVGDYYMKQKNYSAALSRFCEALIYKPKDAAATYRLGVALARLGHKAEARKNIEDYLSMLPEGPDAKAAHKELQRLKDVAAASNDGTGYCPAGLLDPPAIQLTGVTPGAQQQPKEPQPKQ
jgi:tetratricopeptide (TPR) repeat protein